jgi:DNA recombination protein RmuC
MNQDVLIIGVLVLAGFWFIYSKLRSFGDGGVDEEKTKDIVNQVFGEMSDKIIGQAKAILEGDKEAIYKDNQNKKQTIERIVADLRKEIDQRQEEIRELEKDRNKKFGDISRSIEEHRKITNELKASTEALSRVLSNNQTRGAWGERIIEDILTDNGLIENIHYQKQTALPGTSVKPDITLLLPNKRVVSIDVKFPYAEVQQMANAETKSQREQHLKKFETDLKDKVSQINKRGYINIEAGTLDYAIMFVPNEMLFSFINQKFPHVVDDAMAKKIMIVSPFTFLIVARTVMESYRNFMVENNLRKIIKHIGEFVEEWERFTKEFVKFDESIAKMREVFDKIHSTRYQRMQLRIRRIEDYQKSSRIENGKNEALEASTKR